MSTGCTPPILSFAVCLLYGKPILSFAVCLLYGKSPLCACWYRLHTEPYKNHQFLIEAQVRGLVEIISDLALLDDYGEEIDGIFYQYKNSNSMFRLPGPSLNSGYILSILVYPG